MTRVSEVKEFIILVIVITICPETCAIIYIHLLINKHACAMRKRKRKQINTMQETEIARLNPPCWHK